MYDDGLVWRDGELIAFADATCHVLSHMAARGSQVFDVLLVTNTDAGPCGVGLRPHVARFLRSAELMSMTGVGELGDIERAVAKTVLANAAHVDLESPGGCAVVKIIAAWTEEGVGVMPASLTPSIFILITKAGSLPELPEPPASARSAIPKIPPEIFPPSLKVAASYTPGVREQLQSAAQGFDHTIFRTGGGDLAESTTLSVLVVVDGQILVPPLDGVLDGITRRVVLDVAQDAGIPVDVRSIRWDEVVAADEVILSSTTHPVLPIGRLDEQVLPAAPGPVARALGEGVSRLYRGRHQLAERWLTPLQAIT